MTFVIVDRHSFTKRRPLYYRAPAGRHGLFTPDYAKAKRYAIEANARKIAGQIDAGRGTLEVVEVER